MVFFKKNNSLNEVIRVNHAGEFGAKRIYQGQMSVLKSKQDQDMLKMMKDQEEQHLKYFEQEMLKNRVRPSILMPIWNIMGYTLGKATALMGRNAAMIATEAIEEVIDKHYKSQTEKKELPQELKGKIEQFRQEELEHKEKAQDNMKNLNPAHKILYHLIKLGCKASVCIAKKL